MTITHDPDSETPPAPAGVAKAAPSSQSKGRIFELLAVAGDDTGRRFTLDAGEISIGRGDPKKSRSQEILLGDPTVSARQGSFRVADDRLVWSPQSEATNPTRVNGQRLSGCTLSEGDELSMGATRLVVKERTGFGLNTVATLLEARQSTSDTATTLGTTPQPPTVPTESATSSTPSRSSYGSLTLEQGIPNLVGQSFPLSASTMTVGRGQSCDIPVPDPGVSRDHAILQWEGDRLALYHRSHVNPSLVNGQKVAERVELNHGDTLQLADKVVFRVHLDPGPLPEETVQVEVSEAEAQLSLSERMEQKLALDDSIERDFRVVGSFLDVDVVGSYKMKTEAKNPEQIILSFERFRVFVADVVEEHQGLVLNSNGDELMCFFESTYNAVKAGSEILRRLDDFNESQNRLASPFRFRIGIHTGASLVDKQRGVAYSATLDTAGHLQKYAETNGLLISEDTLRALPDGLPFQPAETLPLEQIQSYRLTGWIE